MNISRMIQLLEEVRAANGDLDVVVCCPDELVNAGDLVAIDAGLIIDQDNKQVFVAEFELVQAYMDQPR